MRWMHRIGDDALARMEGVGAFGGNRLGRVAAQNRLGLCRGNFESREVLDGAGPSELGIIKDGVAMNDCGEPGDRRYKKNDVPQRSGEDGAFGNAALDPAIAEIVAGEKFSGGKGAGEESADAAEETLMEVAPGNVELGLHHDGRGRMNGGHPRGGRRALSQDVVPAIDLAQRHESRSIAWLGTRKYGFGRGRRGCLERSRTRGFGQKPSTF